MTIFNGRVGQVNSNTLTTTISERRQKMYNIQFMYVSNKKIILNNYNFLKVFHIDSFHGHSMILDPSFQVLILVD